MLSSLLLVGCLAIAQPQGGAEDELRLTVRRWENGLNATELKEREEAEAKLIELGPRVLDLLRPINERTPAEVQQRIGRIRQRLQQAEAELAGRSSVVTWNSGAAPVWKILDALAAQTGNKIVDFRERLGHEKTNPEVNVTFQKAPFWPALDEVLDKAGFSIYADGESQAISVVNREAGQRLRRAAAAYSGPLRLEPLRIAAARDLRQEGSQSLRLAVEVAWEPRIRPIYFRQRLADVTALDEQGKSLGIDSAGATLELPVEAGKMAKELILPLVPPVRDVKRIGRISGKLAALLPGRMETFRFDHLTTATQVEKRVAQTTVILERVQKNNDNWEVRLRVRFDQPGDSLESHRAWIEQNEAYLEGPDGKPIAYDAKEATEHADNETGIAFIFNLKEPPAECRFVYKTPAAILDTTFDYEFKDVPLP